MTSDRRYLKLGFVGDVILGDVYGIYTTDDSGWGDATV